MTGNNSWQCPVTVQGVIYENMRTMAKAAGISFCCACKRKLRGFSPEEVFTGRLRIAAARPVKRLRGKPVFVGGHLYPSLTNAYSSLRPEASFVAVRARLMSGWTLEHALEVEPKIDGRKTRHLQKMCSVAGQTERPSETALLVPRNGVMEASSSSLDPTPVTSTEAGYTVYASPKSKKRLRCGRRKVQLNVDGKLFASTAALAAAYGLCKRLVYNRIHVNGWSPKRAVSENVCESVEVNGTTYRSAYFAWRKIGRNSLQKFTYRHKLRMPIEVCLGFQPMPKKVTTWFDGKGYTSNKALAAAFGLSPQALMGRLKNMSLREALTFVPPNNGVYSPGYFKKYPDVAETKGRLYFVRLKLSAGTLQKIGITTKEICSRLQLKYEFIAELRGTLAEMYEIEQQILKSFSSYLERADESFDGKTETFRLTPALEMAVVRMINAAAPQDGDAQRSQGKSAEPGSDNATPNQQR